MASESRDPASSIPASPRVGLHMQSPILSQLQPGSGGSDHNDFQDPYYHSHDHSGAQPDEPEQLRNRHRKDVDEEDQNISIAASNKHAEMTIAPFLAKHIPLQYNPVSHDVDAAQTTELEEPRNNTKYCYRHRPDLKCRRQVNEPSMQQLQNELATLTQSDQQAISHVWSLFSAAPGKHRNLMLQGILTQCCFPQLSYISASIRDLIKIDFLSALPAELGFKILCYLDTASLCKAAQVSEKWRSLADDDVVWHRMCEQHIDRKCTKCGWGLPSLERRRLRMEKRQIQLRATGRGLNEWSPDITPVPEEPPESHEVPLGAGGKSKRHREEDARLTAHSVKRKCTGSSSREALASVDSDLSSSTPKTRPWKDVYKDRFKVGTAWKHGRCTTKIFKGHTNGVTCLQFDDNVLITGSYDSSIKVWDVNTGELVRTLTGHRSGIRCLQFDDSKLMTGSLDSTLKLWDWRKGECLRTFNAHNDGIIALHFIEGWVATGSKDKTVRVWNAEKKETFLLRGHTDWINSVKIDAPSRTLFSASDDLTVRLWDLDTKKCIKVFEGHVGQVQQVTLMPVDFELDETQVPPHDNDDDASSVSSVTMAEQHRRSSTPAAAQPFWPGDPARPAPPKYMLTGALDSTIRLWNTHFTPAAHQCPPTSPDILPTDPLTNSHVPRAQACVRTFFGHVEGIWALSADHLRLISGSEDRMMKVWDPRTGKCERTFAGHQGPVTCAWLSDSRVASGSDDCEVRMLTFGDG